MTRKRWCGIGASFAARTVCAALILCAGAMAGAQTEDAGDAYAKLMAEADGYGDYNKQIERLLQSQEAEIAAYGAQIDGLEATAAEVQPLLDKMFTNLETFIGNDLPFMLEERNDRLDKLRDLMSQDGPPAEKFRRLLEAYQIEIEYGRTMDAYKGKLADGRDVYFLHLGRVSLMYQTTDGTETAYWDGDNNSWVVDKRYARAVTNAIQMAEETVAPDLVTLPVPAARETRS